MKTEIKQRLAALRAEMKKLDIDAWYISGTDPHSSEYLPKRWETREYIAGFTGSYGLVAVTLDKAALWTDSRYFLQAAEELEGTGIEMQKLRVTDAVSPDTWLSQNLPAGSKVGLDAQSLTVDAFRGLQKGFLKKDIELVETPDLLEAIWEDRPAVPDDKVFELDVKYAGVGRPEKQQKIAGELASAGADIHVVSMLDELAWLYNLRGSDVPYNPVFTGFAVIGEKESVLFVDSGKIDSDLKSKIEADGVKVKNYTTFYNYLAEIEGKTVFVDPSTLNFAAYSALAASNEIVEGTSLVAIQKALKNETELEGFKSAMKKDGVALVESIFWLKAIIGKQTVTDYEFGQKLAEFRAKQDGFKGESFTPIVGYKSRGALVHLHIGADDALPLDADGVVLFDSGGQYIDGTTDVTRTIALGAVSDQFKTDFTLTLKGMIGLTQAKFPYGVKGCHLDILARQALWDNGMNYGHGTGHGVGHFLNVHEGPMAIRLEYNENLMQPGQVLSNEPAFYREGQYGLRTENMMVCVERETTEFGRFLGFDTLTLCPIDTTLIKVELLSEKERKWLNDYHRWVNEELKPLLEEKYHNFLDEITQEI
ncbi:aminopeptidase P family N-terminal domain-containing protein [Draconibacterium sp. IB214405]|uniref:aminopeptidase P family N-terminal domain-containing protein n=1 Tax=Draconibacterium sp. IB214405 TaxID=3097352 RepID=UPI002A16FEAA|nr:aminopeptidase P family N-terminal domain-containing protein [Draconibacterium sp. IB214405]MDX8339890.1 aminopeptidase P family N-terminal domain-containing protein [Draconibacterium sp. IB214405]